MATNEAAAKPAGESSHWRAVIKRKPHDPSKPLRPSKWGDREAFCQSLVRGEPHRAALVAAGYTDCAATSSNALRCMREGDVAARLEWLRADAAKRDGAESWLRRSRMIAALENMIAADRAGMFTSDGELKLLDELTPDQRALIDSIRPTKSGREALMGSRLAAMQLLARLEGLEAPAKQEMRVTHVEARYTDIELARWIAARLEDAGRGLDTIDITPETKGAA